MLREWSRTGSRTKQWDPVPTWRTECYWFALHLCCILMCLKGKLRSKAGDTLGDFVCRYRRFWSAAKFAGEFRRWLMRAHLAILYADSGDLPLQFYSQAPSIVDVRHFEKARDQNRPIWSVHSSGDSQRRAYKIAGTGTPNTGEFNRRYLTCQMPAILYADHIGENLNRRRSAYKIA